MGAHEQGVVSWVCRAWHSGRGLGPTQAFTGQHRRHGHHLMVLVGNGTLFVIVVPVAGTGGSGGEVCR